MEVRMLIAIDCSISKFLFYFVDEPADFACASSDMSLMKMDILQLQTKNIFLLGKRYSVTLIHHCRLE